VPTAHPGRGRHARGLRGHRRGRAARCRDAGATRSTPRQWPSPACWPVLDAREVARPLAEARRREGWFEARAVGSRADATPRPWASLPELLASRCPAPHARAHGRCAARRTPLRRMTCTLAHLPAWACKPLQADVLPGWCSKRWNARLEPPLRSLQSRQHSRGSLPCGPPSQAFPDETAPCCGW
jgi:hypothetical protein